MSIDYPARLEQIKSLMRDREISLLIVVSPSSHSMSSAVGNVRFLTDWIQKWDSSFVLVPENSDPIIFATTPFYAHIAKKSSWIADVRIVSTDQFGIETRKIAEQLRLKDAIGVAGIDDAPAKVWNSLVQAFPRESLVRADDILEEAKIIKSQREIALMQEAADLSKLMFENLPEFAREGEWEYKVRAQMEYSARIRGAELADVWLSAGQPAYNPCGYSVYENLRRFARGDQILVGTYVVWKGYWSHELRTAVIGKASQLQKDAYGTVVEAQSAAIRLMKPNVSVKEINSTAKAIVEKAGYIVPFRIGHGLGLEYGTWDPISKAFSDPWQSKVPPEFMLKEGMALELHVSAMDPKLRRPSAVIGDVCIITDSGVSVLTRSARELWEIT